MSPECHSERKNSVGILQSKNLAELKMHMNIMKYIKVRISKHTIKTRKSNRFSTTFTGVWGPFIRSEKLEVVVGYNPSKHIMRL